MSITVYTYNDKVLKNVATDKWLKKKEIPTEITLSNGQTWKLATLALNDGGEGIKIVNDVTANGVNLGTIYYYTFAAAQRIASIIPEGWHIPTSEEAQLLIDTYSNDIPALCSVNGGWNDNLHGTNTSGFSAVPDGFYPGSPSVAGLGQSEFCQINSGTQYVSDVLEIGINSGTLSRLRITQCPVAGYIPIRLIKDSN